MASYRKQPKEQCGDPYRIPAMPGHQCFPRCITEGRGKCFLIQLPILIFIVCGLRGGVTGNTASWDGAAG